MALLYPAIDLMGGQVVRLRQGLAVEKTVYGEDPVEFALRWEKAGGDWLHIVDLDAAFTGEQKNLEALRRITNAVKIPCEIGGGIRTEAAIERALDAGAARVIIGTKAIESIGFVEESVRRFGSEAVAVGIDAKNGMVALHGWVKTSEQTAEDLARAVEGAGAGTIIYTDIATDGMLQGPNFAETERILRAVRCNVIASGGVSNAEDVRKLDALPGLHGIIIGRALYEGALQLEEVARRV